MKFQKHGSVRFTVHGQILHAEVQGPWNQELIDHYGDEIQPLVAQVAARGAWAVVITLHGEAICPPDALAAIRRNAVEHARQWRRTCTAYVIGPEVPGYKLMDRMWRGVYEDLMPCEIFEDDAAALAWAEGMISAASSGPA